MSIDCFVFVTLEYSFLRSVILFSGRTHTCMIINTTSISTNVLNHHIVLCFYVLEVIVGGLLSRGQQRGKHDSSFCHFSVSTETNFCAIMGKTKKFSSCFYVFVSTQINCLFMRCSDATLLANKCIPFKQ